MLANELYVKLKIILEYMEHFDAEYFDAGLKRFDEYKRQLKLNFDC